MYGYSESKLDASVLEQENDLTYNILPYYNSTI